MMIKQIAEEILKKHNSFYLYDENIILKSIENLKLNFKGVSFLYSAKANPHKDVIRSITCSGFGIDAASLAEVMMGRENNVPKEKIQYSAPSKTRNDIEKSIDYTTIIADSYNEILLISEVAKERKTIAEVGIRVNPDFTFFSDTGIPSKFGIDEEQLFNSISNLNKIENIKISGLHIHLRCQELKFEVLEQYYDKILNLAERFQLESGINLSFINMGSGMGIPYTDDGIPLDISALGSTTDLLAEKFNAKFPTAKLYIETGRYLVGKCGYYVTKVIDKKVSYGKTFVLLHNTMNGFFRPSLAQMIKKANAEDELMGYEPLYTIKNAFGIDCISKSDEFETVTMVGNLCTSADVLAHDISLPKLEIGDGIMITNAGGYAIVLSPTQFASLEPPVEVFLPKDEK